MSTSMTLGDFELADFPIGGGDPIDIASDTLGRWVPAIVPGGVTESLLAAGRIEDPYFGGNEPTVSWIEEKDWWYRARFARPEMSQADRVRLVFEGLDTVADVWLNGALLGHHENQFRPAAFDVTEALADENTLVIRFSPPLAGRSIPPQILDEMTKLVANLGAVGGEAGVSTEDNAMLATLPLATTLRKASFSWGWDFGPRVPSIGVWRPVHLDVERGAIITGHHIALTNLAPDHATATVQLTVEAEAITAKDLVAHVKIMEPGGRVFSAKIPLADGTGTTTIEIDHPALWWTHDLGEPALHDVEIDLIADGEVTDTVTDRVGLRTLTLDRGVKGDRRFQFILNGMPLFARGAAWLPASTLVGSVSVETYRDRILRAREGNLTMLRVWGGGIYEHDAFYEACDELGVLVWQDFMFACIDYPDDDPHLAAEVALEAAYQVKRLRNRACLALWAGNNEVQTLHMGAYLSVDEGNWGWHFFNQLLPETVAEHDGITPYWPGSPYGEDNGIFSINGVDDGDRHTWEVWHGMNIPGLTVGPSEYPTVGDSRHYRRYAYDTARFVSEFGIHASPELATLRRWIPEADLAVHSPVFDLHNKDNPKNKGDELLSVTTGLPVGLEQYQDFTQAVQAEGMLFGIEHYRRRQPETAGALMWQFNDVWPGFSWSVMDYDGVPKAAYYAARRACAPLAVSFRQADDGSLEVWLINNTAGEVCVIIDVELGNFDGTDRETRRIAGSAHPGESLIVATIPAEDVRPGPARYAWVSSPTGEFPPARKHFAEIGQLELGPSHLTVTRMDSSMRIRSTGYSYQVRIEQPKPGIRLSDNCFDLRDGDEVTIEVSGADATWLAVVGYAGQETTVEAGAR